MIAVDLTPSPPSPPGEKTGETGDRVRLPFVCLPVFLPYLLVKKFRIIVSIMLSKIDVASGMKSFDLPNSKCRSPGRRPRGSLSENMKTRPMTTITIPATMRKRPVSVQFIKKSSIRGRLKKFPVAGRSYSDLPATVNC
jgi:hypothetical protein